MATRRKPPQTSQVAKLQGLVKAVLDLARKARRNNKSLNGDNYYANKIVELRADATNTFERLAGRSEGDISALAEMLEVVFAANTPWPRRLAVSKELEFSLLRTWKGVVGDEEPNEEEGLFSLGTLASTKRAYLVKIGRQMNGSFSVGWYDASAVMMRRLLEIAIIEAHEHLHLENQIKDAQGNYLQLTGIIDMTIGRNSFHLTPNTRKYLPKLRDAGHASAHGRYYHAKKSDIEEIKRPFRVVMEEFLHLANLL